MHIRTRVAKLDSEINGNNYCCASILKHSMIIINCTLEGHEQEKKRAY